VDVFFETRCSYNCVSYVVWLTDQNLMMLFLHLRYFVLTRWRLLL